MIIIKILFFFLFLVQATTAQDINVPKCGNPNIIALSAGLHISTITTSIHSINFIKKYQFKQTGIELPEFNTVLILYENQKISIGIGTKDIVCELLIENGLDAIKLAEEIIPRNI